MFGDLVESKHPSCADPAAGRGPSTGGRSPPPRSPLGRFVPTGRPPAVEPDRKKSRILSDNRDRTDGPCNRRIGARAYPESGRPLIGSDQLTIPSINPSNQSQARSVAWCARSSSDAPIWSFSGPVVPFFLITGLSKGLSMSLSRAPRIARLSSNASSSLRPIVAATAATAAVSHPGGT